MHRYMERYPLGRNYTKFSCFKDLFVKLVERSALIKYLFSEYVVQLMTKVGIIIQSLFSVLLSFDEA